MEKLVPVLRLVGVGFYIGACIVGGILLGFWLDSVFKTSPILLLVFLIIGLVAAFWGVYQMLIPIINSENKNQNKKPRR
jgi:F0F1-type ATP synthase assembly protein I